MEAAVGSVRDAVQAPALSWPEAQAHCQLHGGAKAPEGLLKVFTEDFINSHVT